MVAQVTALSHMQTYGMNKHYWLKKKPTLFNFVIFIVLPLCSAIHSFIQRHMGNVLRESQKQTRNTELTWYMTVSLDFSHTLLTCIFMSASIIKYMWKVLYDQYRLTTIIVVYPNFSLMVFIQNIFKKGYYKELV